MLDLAVLENLKSQIVEIIGARIDLRKAGSTSWKALCPWHDDRNPSLTVSEKKRTWRCWVCNEGGDTIDFVKKFYSTDFIGALEILGVKIESVERETVVQMTRVLEEIANDANALLLKLEVDEDNLCFFSRHVNWLINATPPLERDAILYRWERWAEDEFEKIEEEREKIYSVVKQKKREVFEWMQQQRLAK